MSFAETLKQERARKTIEKLRPWLNHSRMCLYNDPQEPRIPCTCGLWKTIEDLTGESLAIRRDCVSPHQMPAKPVFPENRIITEGCEPTSKSYQSLVAAFKAHSK
jgi:hypothetical protein